MSGEVKARQWWIVWKSGYKNQATVTTEKPKEFNESLIHVISRSHYDKAIKALKLAVTSGEFFSRHADCKRDSWSCRCEFCKDVSASKNLNEARHTLEELGELL